jgi:hypothetical protein
MTRTNSAAVAVWVCLVPLTAISQGSSDSLTASAKQHSAFVKGNIIKSAEMMLDSILST